MDRIVSRLEREIYGITSNEQMRFKKEFSIRLIEFEAWWQAIGVQELWKRIEQCVIIFGYPKMHLVSHISQSIRRMGSGDNFTTNISERLHIGNVKEVYRSSNKVNYIRQMLKHNDWSTSLDYMQETLSYLALQGWYDIDSAKVFNLLSAADKWQNTRRAHLLRLQQCQHEQFFRPVSPQVHHLSETHVRGMCRSIKLTSLRDTSEDLEFPTLVSYSVHILKRTGDPNLVDSCSDPIRMYSLTMYLLNFKMGCRTTINHFTALHLLSVCDLIAR
jgi:hypothetical protein